MSLRFVPKAQVGNQLAVDQVMVLCQTGHMALSKAMLTHCTEAYSFRQTIYKSLKGVDYVILIYYVHY